MSPQLHWRIDKVKQRLLGLYVSSSWGEGKGFTVCVRGAAGSHLRGVEGECEVALLLRGNSTMRSAEKELE